MAADVKLERVSKLYGSYKAVDEVTLAIREGSFISLLGPSGAGKSTILRMIGGFELPDYGTIRIAGHDVTMLAPYRRDFAATTRENVTQRFFKPTSDPNLVRRIADDMAAEPPGIGVGAMIGMNNMNYAAALGDINVPIIAINSDRLPTDLDRIRLHAPTFRVKLMPGTGHFLMIEEASRFNALLDATVQELAGSEPRPTS